MRIKIRGVRIDLSSLIQVRWYPYPKIYLHENFEGTAKWIARGITALGIGVSFLALPSIIDVGVAIAFLGIEFFVEKIVFEYSVVIVQPLPDFKIDESQWITNGYLFPNPAYQQQYDLQNHFGLVYKDEAYAKAFFDYLVSWNQDSRDDGDNNICISFVIEANNSFTTYLYANPNRKWLDEMFNAYHEEIKYEKYGKRQQSMIMQMVYWKTLPNMEGTLFYSFLEAQPKNRKFHFAPFYMVDGAPTIVESHVITKYRYSLKYRQDVGKDDLEFYYGATIQIDPKIKRAISSNPRETVNELFKKAIIECVSHAKSIQFILAPNYETSPPVICIHFNTSEEARDGYERVLSRFTNSGSSALFKKKDGKLSMTLSEHAKFSIETELLNYSEDNYQGFVDSEQSKSKVVLTFGFDHLGQTILVATQRDFSPLLLNKVQFQS